MRPNPLQNVQKRLSDINQRMELLSKGPAFRANAVLPQKLRYNIRQSRFETQPARHSKAEQSQSSRQTKSSANLLSSGKKDFALELDRLIQKEASKAGVNADLIRAIVKTESNGNPNAVSKAGAIGLMQLMPGTARQLGVNPKDPLENLRGGIHYLKNLAKRYGDLDKTLAAYNAGPGNVQKYGDVPPFRETRRYIQKIRSELFDERR